MAHTAPWPSELPHSGSPLLGGVCSYITTLTGARVSFVRAAACVLAIANAWLIAAYPVLWWLKSTDLGHRLEVSLAPRLRRYPEPSYAFATFAVLLAFSVRSQSFAALAAVVQPKEAAVPASDDSQPPPADPVAVAAPEPPAPPVPDPDPAPEPQTVAVAEPVAAAAPEPSIREEERGASERRELEAEVRRFIKDADHAEVAARTKKNGRPLRAYYAGAALAAIEDDIAQTDRSIIVEDHLEASSLNSLRVVVPERQVLASVTERWSTTAYDRRTGKCLWMIPTHKVPQTISLVRVPDGWRIVKIDFHKPTPEAVACR